MQTLCYIVSRDRHCIAVLLLAQPRCKNLVILALVIALGCEALVELAALGPLARAACLGLLHARCLVLACLGLQHCGGLGLGQAQPCSPEDLFIRVLGKQLSLLTSEKAEQLHHC